MPAAPPAVRPESNDPIRRLDLRDLAAPAPLLEGLAAAGHLGPGEVLELLTPLMPYPLLQALTERGFEVAAERRHDGSACVRVIRPGARAVP